MSLFCDLLGHWPALFGLRRRQGRWRTRCGLCGRCLIRDRGLWEEAARCDE